MPETLRIPVKKELSEQDIKVLAAWVSQAPFFIGFDKIEIENLGKIHTVYRG